MRDHVKELCRQLKPVLGRRVDRLWSAYLAESDHDGKADIEQVLELLAAKHLGKDYQPDRSPFPPPERRFAGSGEIRLGKVSYGGKEIYPFSLKANRLKEHILVAGRSGSGKTNLTFVLMKSLMDHGIKVLALDWKRNYRNLMSFQKSLRVYTIGRNVAPFRFNPLIPPAGCEPGLWIKLIIDTIADAYLGGEGVISLLISGLDHLYREAGVYDGNVSQWPTIQQLLAWLRKAKLKGRAGMWQASAERILQAMLYGEFGKVLNSQDNSHIAELLNHDVVLEMDGLASNSDRTMFAGALTLYLYRYRLAVGYQKKLSNMVILEEAHNLLHKKSSVTKESVLETSIRMIREYGLGYVFVDQSASLLSQVAFANSYATIALNQKLRADIQTITGAMNLTDDQKQSLSILPVGTAVVRLADEHPFCFLLKVPLCGIKEGTVTDLTVKGRWESCHGSSGLNKPATAKQTVISAIPSSDNNKKVNKIEAKEKSHPPTPCESEEKKNISSDSQTKPPNKLLTAEAKRFLQDITTQPLSTTVSRYERLHLSRRHGDAVRRFLTENELVEPVRLATRTGQVVLYLLTPQGRQVCESLNIDPGPWHKESIEHRYWVNKTAQYYQKQGYEITYEFAIKGNGLIDLLAEKPGKRIAIEVETGKSDIVTNIKKAPKAYPDKFIFVATCPQAVSMCQKAIDSVRQEIDMQIELLTWLDVS